MRSWMWFNRWELQPMFPKMQASIKTLNTDITNLNKTLNAVNIQLILSQTNAQTEVRHLLAQNNCANSTTVSPPITSPVISSPTTPVSTHSPLIFCQSAKYCANAVESNNYADPNDCSAYYFCYPNYHFWALAFCLHGYRSQSSAHDRVFPIRVVSQNLHFPTTAHLQIISTLQYRVIVLHMKYVMMAIIYSFVVLMGYLYNQNIGYCDIPANASPKCTTNSQ